MTQLSRPLVGQDEKDGLIVVLSGPSGVGKGSVQRGVHGLIPNSWLSVSATTRPPRDGEEEGVHYFFLRREDFEQLINDDGFLEWAEYAGHLYGTPRRPIRDQVDLGKVVLLDIEVQGAMQVRARVPESLLIFVSPPSFEELERRLRQRGTEDEDQIRRRLDRASVELAESTNFDHVVVNEDLESCIDEVAERIASAIARLRH